MRPLLSFVLLAACSAAPTTASPDATVPSPDGAAASVWGERCGDNEDNDGDDLVDEDCVGMFAGVFAPRVSTDPALTAIENAAGRKLSVLQTYHSLTATGIARTAPDLEAIFARGQVAHLNVEPSGYTAAQYAAPNTNPVAHDLDAMATAIATALAANPNGRVLLTFGAEMNGNWVDWGCLSASQYIALYRSAHARVTAALAQHAIDPRRLRWAYGPNATSSANCGSAAGYYPGHAYVDVLGMSAYRTENDSVDASVITYVNALFNTLDYPAAWRRDRFVLLQTGSRDTADRNAWIATLFAKLAADDRMAGVIYFDAADWAAPASALAPAVAAAPVSDTLEHVFAPYFFDVPYAHVAFAEIQWLRESGMTSGCATAPPQFCPDDLIETADAAALITRALPNADVTLPDSVRETDITNALSALGKTPPPANDVRATRARAAYLIAHAARPPDSK